MHPTAVRLATYFGTLFAAGAVIAGSVNVSADLLGSARLAGPLVVPAKPSYIAAVKPVAPSPIEVRSPVAVTVPQSPPPVVAVATAAAPDRVGPTHIVDASSLNLRASASTASATLVSLPRGARVTLAESVGSWSKVSTPEGTTGWVFSRYLREESLVASAE